MRPLQASPTGTLIGAPVSMAFMPRRQPSVEAMATQRATSLPRCWATSSIMSMPAFSSFTRMAL